MHSFVREKLEVQALVDAFFFVREKFEVQALFNVLFLVREKLELKALVPPSSRIYGGFTL